MVRGKKILIMGLPGAGKTFLAREIYKDLNAIWLNGDKVRNKYKDWDFSKEGRIRQAKRMNFLSNQFVQKGKNVVMDFICPNEDSFKNLKVDFIIWVDTIKTGRWIRRHLEDINPVFKKPKIYNLRVTTKDAKFWKVIALDKIENLKWNNQKPTAQMLGRYQPWHEGHAELFRSIVRKNLQVNIQVKDTAGLDRNNPYSFKKVKQNIDRALKEFKSRYIVTKSPNIVEIVYGRKVGYKIRKVLTPIKYRRISATNIRKNLKKIKN